MNKNELLQKNNTLINPGGPDGKISAENHREINEDIINYVDYILTLSASGWTEKSDLKEVVLGNGKTVIVKQITGYEGGTGTLPAYFADKVGKYYAKVGGFTTDINNASVFSADLTGYIKSLEVKPAIGIQAGVNKANLNLITADHYYSYGNGNKYPLSGFNALGPYKIEPNTDYKVPTTYTDQTAFFDGNLNFIGGLAQVNPSTNVFTTPANAAYVGLSVKTQHLAAFMLAKANEYPAKYSPYIETLPGISISTDQIDSLYQKIRADIGYDIINIIDPSIIQYDKYFSYATGNLATASGYVALGPYPIEGGEPYKISDFQTDQIAFFDKTNTFISGIAQVDPVTHIFTPPEDAAYIGVSAKPFQASTLVLSKVNLFPSGYVPFGVSVIKGLSLQGKTSEIKVTADPSDADATYKGKNAIQEALDNITDASSTNRYNILVKKGLYKITTAAEFLGNVGYPAMVCPKDFVDISGQGSDVTIIWAELPYVDGNIGASVDGNTYPRDKYQTLYNFAGDLTIRDLTFIGKNLRYTNHQDDGRGAYKKRYYENVNFIFYGDKGYLKPLGIGNFSGEETYVTGGMSITDHGDPFACHNNVDFKKPCLWSFKGHQFISSGSKTAIELQNDGSLLQDKLELIGCAFGGKSYILNYIDVWLKGDINLDSFNHSEWLITGHSNAPFLFRNLVGGLSLRILSNTTGNTSTVRYNQNSSAYPVLIKNNHANTDASIYYNSRQFIDGYIVQDGSPGLKGVAFGCKDLAETAYAYNAGINYTSMGKRLGDCSTTNKVLQVIIDGVAVNITFNKNYINYTNSQILAEINTAISGKGTADLYAYGRGYFPELPDVMERVYNNSASFIPKGTVVKKVNGFIEPANVGDVIAGVTLEDVPVKSVDAEGMLKGQGRILKRGYISTSTSEAFYVRTNTPGAAKYKPVNGVLTSNASGNILATVDVGVVSINC